VSILKPLCGADPNAYESLRSHCIQDYPQFEIIFGVSDPEDTAVPLVRRLIEEFPDLKIQLITCRKFLGSNYKISNLIQMLPLAEYEYVLVNDSDISVGPEYLGEVMYEFQNNRVGLVTCLYRGIAASSFGSRLESLGISTDFIPGVLAAQQLEDGIRFGLGSTLAFNRRALDSVGGFEVVADYLGDDYELGKRVADAGYSVALAECVVDHHLPDYSLGEYFRHQLRWARSIRHSRPGGYASLVFTFGFAWAMANVILTPLAAWPWLLLAVTLVFRYAVAFAVGVRILHDDQLRKTFWMVPLRDLIAVGVWAASFAGRRIVWRGHHFTLENGKLRP
jgi:ceramide glucosyltransferase